MFRLIVRIYSNNYLLNTCVSHSIQQHNNQIWATIEQTVSEKQRATEEIS